MVVARSIDEEVRKGESGRRKCKMTAAREPGACQNVRGRNSWAERFGSGMKTLMINDGELHDGVVVTNVDVNAELHGLLTMKTLIVYDELYV